MNNLIVKTILGFAFLMLVLALALFVPAGSLGFWQAWVFLAVWAVCVVLITAYLIKHDQRLLAGRVKAGPVAEPKRASRSSRVWPVCFSLACLSFRLGLPFSLVGCAACRELGVRSVRGAWLFYRFPGIQREQLYQCHYRGVGTSKRWLPVGRTAWSGIPCMRGPSFCCFLRRLPGDLGGDPFALCRSYLVVAVRLLEEEKLLLANLGGYEEYRQKVRYRLIPFIW